jgi:hypothetical protein
MEISARKFDYERLLKLGQLPIYKLAYPHTKIYKYYQ